MPKAKINWLGNPPKQKKVKPIKLVKGVVGAILGITLIKAVVNTLNA